MTESLFPLQPVEEGVKGEDTHTAKVGDYLAEKLGKNPEEDLYYTYEVRPYMDELITNKAVDYIDKHANDTTPFFLFVPFSLPHAPPLPNPAFQNEDDKKNYTDYQNVLREIDYNAGRIIDAIDNNGNLKNNTIVVWMSDNGPETHQGNNILYGAQSDPGPFRGEFPSGWEGAIRTPCIIRWPGYIQAGRSSNEIVSALDFYATFANIAGAQDKIKTYKFTTDDGQKYQYDYIVIEVNKEENEDKEDKEYKPLIIDSIDQSNFFMAQEEEDSEPTPSNRESVMFFYGDDLLSIKWRNFKYHTVVNEPSQGTVRMAGQGLITSYKNALTYPWVFDIENDPKELWNISTSNIWIGGPMSKISGEYLQSIENCPNTEAGAEKLRTCKPYSPGRRALPTSIILPFPEG